MDRIKESFDSLPIATCFFDKSGVVRLVNRRMLVIANWLRKGGIQSLAEMESALYAPPAGVRCIDQCLRIYRFPDGKALRFSQERITTKAGAQYTQITAADVTELIRKQDQLKAENAKLAEANARMRRLLAQMPEIIRQEETLAMKLRVHDDIGHCILAARRLLLRHTDQKEIHASAALWEQSISVLHRSSQITAHRTVGGGEKTSGRTGRQCSADRECAANAADARTERAGDLRMCGELRPSRRRNRTVCALLPEAGLHGGRPDQQRCGAKGKDHRGRRPFHAASTHRRGRRQNGGLEHPSL